ncbi:MAG TPA: alpha/beta hydrolase [Streptosporangiaceae bacterium]
MSPGPVLAGPGFDGTPRPGALASVTGLARLYAALLDRLDVWDVTVIGNSVGGWIAAELALLNNPRVSGAILINAVGIEVEGHPVTDISRLSPQQVMALSFHDPGRFTSDPGAPGRGAGAPGGRVAMCGHGVQPPR